MHIQRLLMCGLTPAPGRNRDETPNRWTACWHAIESSLTTPPNVVAKPSDATR